MVAWKAALGVVDRLREAAGRSWWGEIGLEGRGQERWLGVHYRDLFGSGRKWRARAIRKNRPDLKGAPQTVDVTLRSEDIYLRDRLLHSIEVLYGSDSRTMAEQELGERPLTCRRVRRVVDRIRCRKEAFQRRFFLSGKPDDVDPLPGTFDALVQDLKQETNILPEFWQQGGEKTLRCLAQRIIEQSAEGLSESRRIGEIRDNIMAFFTQRQMLWDAAAPLREVDDPIIRQDLDTLFNQFLLHPSVLLLRPQGARGQVMETIWRRYRRFLESNPMDGGEQVQQAGESTYEARRQSLTQFIFGMPEMPMSFEVTGSVRHRSEMDSYRYLDGGVHYTIVAHGRTSPAPLSQPDSSLRVLEKPSVGTVPRQDSSITLDQQPELVNPEEEKERKFLESKGLDNQIPIPQDPLTDPELQQKKELPPKVDESKSLEQARQEALSEAREKFREKYFSRQKPPLDGDYGLIRMTGRYVGNKRDSGLFGVQDNERGRVWPAESFNETLRNVIDTIIDNTDVDALYDMGKDGVIEKLSNFMEDLKWGMDFFEEKHKSEVSNAYSHIPYNKPEAEYDMYTYEMTSDVYSHLETICQRWLVMPALVRHRYISIGERRHIMKHIIESCYKYIRSLRGLQRSEGLVAEERMCQYVFGKETLPQKFLFDESRQLIGYDWGSEQKGKPIYNEDESLKDSDANRRIIFKKQDSNEIDIVREIISEDSDDEISDDGLVPELDIEQQDI